jgi:protein-disulfide isomerase
VRSILKFEDELLPMKKLICAAGLVSFVSVAFAQNGLEGLPTANDVVLEVLGKKMTLGDFEKERPTGLFQARNSFYQAQRKALDEFVDEYVLAQQAKKENLSVEKLLDLHVNKAIAADPGDEALRVYYEGLDNIGKPFEEVKDQIKDVIRQRRMAKTKADYIKSLRTAANVNIRLAPPRAIPVLRETPVRGPKDAPVVIVEFSDYECPYCQANQADLDKMEIEYKGKIAFGYKDVPLPMHSHAQKAAEASHCAGDQGKYWEYHDSLFATKQLELPQLKEQARKLNLDGAAFDKCLDSGAQADLVKSTLDEGQSLGVEGTPSYLINGRFFSGGLHYEDLQKIIDEELKIAALRSAAAK